MENTNITVLANRLSEIGYTKAQAKEFILDFISVMKDELVMGNKIRLNGFGIFDVTERAARLGRNPSTGDPVEIPAKRVVKFKAGKEVKDAMNG